MGCYSSKKENQITFRDHADNQQNTIKIQKIANQELKKIEINDVQDKEINLILTPVQAEITQRYPQQVLEQIADLADQCLDHYNSHDIDTAYTMFIKIQQDLKQLENRGFKIQMNQHFKHQFIQLSHLLTQEYNDMIEFNNEILKEGWKLQKDKKNFKVFSRVEGDTVGIKMESILDVPFENFIAVMIQPDHYHAFLPFIIKSIELKNVRRNCKLGAIEMGFPIISNRQAYFQGVLYNRLNHPDPKDREFFMYTRSIHNRKDIQQQCGYEVKSNPKCVQFDYKYLVVKYVPLGKSSGKLVMGMNMDLKLNMLPLSILEIVSINFSQDFFDSIVRISNKFERSIWDEGIKKDPKLFQFTKNVTNQYLRKNKT